MTALQTRPEREQTTGSDRRLLLPGVAGFVLVGLFVLIVAAAGGGDGAVTMDAVAASPEAAPDVAQRAADTLAVFVDVPAENLVPAFTPEPGRSIVERAADPVATGATVACEGFLQGGTVAEFAGWFVADVGAADTAARALFRAMLEQALTDDCPEVLSARR